MKRLATSLFLLVFLGTQFAVAVPVYSCRQTGRVSLQCCCGGEQERNLAQEPVKSCCSKHAEPQQRRTCSADCCHITPLLEETSHLAPDAPSPAAAPHAKTVMTSVPVAPVTWSWSYLSEPSPPRPPVYLQLCRLLA